MNLREFNYLGGFLSVIANKALPCRFSGHYDGRYVLDSWTMRKDRVC